MTLKWTFKVWQNIFSLVLILSIGACTYKSTDKGSDKNSERQVNLAIWGNYFETSEQQRFTTKTGIKVNLTNYSSNEELLAKVQSGGSGIDLAIPSDYMVGIMIKLGLLEKLSLEKIPNSKGVSENFLKLPFDPENSFSLPYAWTVTGLAVHRSLYKSPISGWKDVMADPSLAGKVSLLDDSREALAVALRINGLSVNSSKPEEIDTAKKTLLELKKKIKMFRSDMIDALVNKEVAVGHAFAAEALQAAEKSKGLVEFVIPVEGGTWSVDNAVIFKGAKNQTEAHELINFFLDLESNVNFVKAIKAGPVLTKTRDALPENLKNNPALFPSAAAMAKLEPLRDLGEATSLVEKVWTEIKTQ